MRYILLFKGSCAVCSKIAGMVDDLSVENLEAQSIESTEVRQILSGAGLEAPGRPALLMTSDAGVRMVSGWEMRRHLAGLLGWRRARAIARLAAADWHARLTQSAGPDVPSRRGVVKAGLAGLAGIAGAAVIPGKALAASQPAASGPVLSIAGQSTVERALAVSAVQTAIQTFGPVEPTVQVVTSGREKVLVLAHAQSNVVTLVDNSASATSNPTVLGMAPTPAGDGIRFLTVEGAAIADLAVSNGRATVTAADNGATPNITTGQFRCFLTCILGSVQLSCALACASCAGGGLGLLQCPHCILCAGPLGIHCARLCF